MNEKIAMSKDLIHKDPKHAVATAQPQNSSDDAVTELLPQQAISGDDGEFIKDLQVAVLGTPFPNEQSPVAPEFVDQVVSTAILQSNIDTGEPWNEATRQDPFGNGVKHAGGAERPTDGREMVGKQIGTYRIIRPIGHGGMGIVFEAEDSRLMRRVALKVMQDRVCLHPEAQSRFFREARAAARVEHDHICPIYQVSEESGIPFIAMPLLQGESLESAMKHRSFSVEQAVEISRQAAEGLAAAHKAGLIHRDIKPANIWLESKQDDVIRVRLLDFGLARIEMDDSSATQPGTVMGTPSYMAPEQALGDAIDARADLFSLGAVMYEMFCGKKAFSGENALSVLSSILSRDPSPPNLENPELPESVSKLVMSLLEKQLDRRFPDAGKLAIELRHCQEELKAAKPAAVHLASNQHTPATQSLMIKPWRRHAITSALVALGLLSFVLAGIMIFKTADGNLIVEFDEAVDLRIQNGELQLFDKQGAFKYSFKAEPAAKGIVPGSYQVKVVGADGLSLSTEAFEVKQGETVVLRVTANKSDTHSAGEQHQAGMTVDRPLQFTGKPVIQTEFAREDDNSLPLGMVGKVRHFVQDGSYFMALDSAQPNDFLTLNAPVGLDAGAFSMRCRSNKGNVFCNFCTRSDGTHLRWLSVAVNNGTWRLFMVRQDKINDSIVKKPTNLIASDNTVDPEIMNGKWIDIAARWNGTELQVWLNGKLVHQGALPTDELTWGRALPLQICSKIHEAGQGILEIDRIGIWDQSGD